MILAESNGALQGETADPGASLDQGQKLGRIQVEIRRAIFRKRPIRLPRSKREFNTVTEVSEKVLKGKAVYNTVRYITLLSLQ